MTCIISALRLMIDTCSHAITVLKYRSRVFPSIPSILCGIRDQQSSPYHHHGSWKCYQGLLKLSYHHPSEWDHVSTEVSVETTQVILLLETTNVFQAYPRCSLLHLCKDFGNRKLYYCYSFYLSFDDQPAGAF